MEFETVNIVCMELCVTRVALVPDFSSMEFKKNSIPSSLERPSQYEGLKYM